jgi:hypothetical protein
MSTEERPLLPELLPASQLPFGLEPPGTAGVDVLVNAALPPQQLTYEEQLQQNHMVEQHQQLIAQAHGMDSSGSQPGGGGLVLVPQDAPQGGMLLSVTGQAAGEVELGRAPRFKPSREQREEMEAAMRAGEFKRKCKELEEYARVQGLPYKAVLSWFDRNKTRVMKTEAEIPPAVLVQDPSLLEDGIVANPKAQMPPSNPPPGRFKPTPEQLVGATQ